MNTILKGLVGALFFSMTTACGAFEDGSSGGAPLTDDATQSINTTPKAGPEQPDAGPTYPPLPGRLGDVVLRLPPVDPSPTAPPSTTDPPPDGWCDGEPCPPDDNQTPPEDGACDGGPCPTTESETPPDTDDPPDNNTDGSCGGDPCPPSCPPPTPPCSVCGAD